MSVDIAENNFLSAEILADVANLFDENQPTLENLSREILIELQQNDQSLQSMFALCGQADSTGCSIENIRFIFSSFLTHMLINSNEISSKCAP